jgi:ABC-2 type transport system permease protein
MTEPRAAGAIYDLGYQRYDGARLSRGNAIRTLIAFSTRTAFGIGRGNRSKILPFLLTGFVLLPALSQVMVASATGGVIGISYPNQLTFTAFLLAMFSAAQAPELVVTDRQHGVLTLYLSRSLRGADYALAKVAALVLAMLVLSLGPQLVIFVGNVLLATEPWTKLTQEYRKLVPIVVGSVMTSWLMASVGLALASMASRRAYATAAVIAFFVILPAASEVIRQVTMGNAKRYAVLINPVHLMTGFTTWLFEIEARARTTIGRADLPPQLYLYIMVAVSLLGTGILVLRYRRTAA